MKDYYAILGIESNAGEAAIKSRYRSLVLIYHPDKNPENQDKFLDLNEAYKTLMDPFLRETYDKEFKEYRKLERKMSGEHQIKTFRSRIRDGANVNIEIDFTPDIKSFKDTNKIEDKNGNFIEKNVNIERYIKCPACGGEGRDKGTIAITCSHCRGTGAVKNHQTNIDEACRECNGYGDIFLYKCKTCGGLGRIKMTEEVKLNFSTDELLNGKKSIVFEGMGDCGVFGGRNGNLNVFVKIDEDAVNNSDKSFFSKLPFFKKIK